MDTAKATGPAEASETAAIIRSRGLRFPDNPRHISKRTRQLLRRRQYEEREANAVRALVGKDDVAMELGAGIGFMSTLMARTCKAQKVHTFEANPSMIPFIREVHALNEVSDRVELTNAALGARKGKATFYERADFSASSLDADPPGNTSPVIAEHEIDVLNLNTEIKRIKPTALVCDIEGAEANLIPLMDLSTIRVAVVELHPQWIGKAGVQAVFEAFHGAGLTFFPRTASKKVVTFRRDW